MTLQFIHAYAIELEGSVSSKRPHLAGDKPGVTATKFCPCVASPRILA